MKVKRNSKKVNVNDISLRQIFEMFEGGEDSNLEGFDEFDDEEGAPEEGADEGADEDFGEEGDDDFGGEEETSETVSIEIDPNAPLADVLRTIADAIDGGVAETTEGEDEDFGDEDFTDDTEDTDEDFGDEGEDTDDDTDWMPEEDEESPATVANGAPTKKVGTPDYQGKNKQTVKTNLRTVTGNGNAATVGNGAPTKKVGTPEYQGKNKQTVDSKLNPGNQVTQF